MSASLPIHSPARSWAEVDLAAIRHNAALCRRLAGPRGAVMAIVKANAYGHGVDRVAAALLNVTDWFGVANLREALRVREATQGRARGILILGPALPDELDTLVSQGFSASISQSEELEAFSLAAARCGQTARLHVVVDTGMGRIGCPPDRLQALAQQVRRTPHCQLEGLSTHFPSADEDVDYTRNQIGRFRQLVDPLAASAAVHVHLANSAGLIRFPEASAFATLARPGLALYGVSPLPEIAVDLRPALRWITRVSLVRDLPAGTSISYGRRFVTPRPSRVATLTVGYADGYPRHLSGQDAQVLVGGRRCPVLGRVTMDQIVVDVSEAGPVARGDEAVLLGRQGNEEITASELAAKAGTIPWEILTNLSSRVERVYLPAPESTAPPSVEGQTRQIPS